MRPRLAHGDRAMSSETGWLCITANSLTPTGKGSLTSQGCGTELNSHRVQPNSFSESPRRNRRPKGRQLFCPAHPEQQITGNGRKYFLHLLQPEELRSRGFSDKKAKLVIQAHPVLVLSNEWLEELFCPLCGTISWCHIQRHDRVHHSVRWASRELWQQVAHVDPLVPNPSVSQFTRQAARRAGSRRPDGKSFYDPS